MTEWLKWLLSPNSQILPEVPTLVLVLFVASLSISALGWIKPVYIISGGYRYSVAAQMFLTALVWDGPFWGRMTALVLLTYGLWPRTKFPFWDEKEQGRIKVQDSFTYPMSILWPASALLWVALALPVVFHIHGGAKADGGGISVAGTWIALLGLIIDISSGFSSLRFFRIPRGMGFILIWTGAWLGATPFCQSSFWRWSLSALGPLFLMVMFLRKTLLRRILIRKSME